MPKNWVHFYFKKIFVFLLTIFKLGVILVSVIRISQRPKQDVKLLKDEVSIMKFYTLEAVVRGENVKFNKVFTSRDSALDFMFKFYNKHYVYNVNVNEDVCVNGDKHNILYICDSSNSFRINRVTL